MADEVRNAWKGIRTPPAEALKLEEQLTENCLDLEIRCKLLGYYSSNRFTDPKGLQKFHEHLLFTIRTFPENKISCTRYTHIDRTIDGDTAYQNAKQAWLEQVRNNDGNAIILTHAAEFFAREEQSVADELYSKLSAIRPASFIHVI